MEIAHVLVLAEEMGHPVYLKHHLWLYRDEIYSLYVVW